MVEHAASVTVKAPVHQVYELFTHFNDFPKFMSFVKEVTYYDGERSHWVAQVLRPYEWDAVNEDWIPDQQIGWRATRGLHNAGRVKFRALGPALTMVDVYLRYTPPSGPLGEITGVLGVDSYFDSVLQKDLNNFARMVELAPPGALDPMSSHYLFHQGSATIKGTVTNKQRSAMARDPMMSAAAMNERQARIEREAELRRQAEAAREAALKAQAERERQTLRAQQAMLEREAVRRRQEQLHGEGNQRLRDTVPLDRRHIYAAWAHGLGDKDGGRARFPNFTEDPMTSRRPNRPRISEPPKTDD